MPCIQTPLSLHYVLRLLSVTVNFEIAKASICRSQGRNTLESYVGICEGEAYTEDISDDDGE